MKITKTIFFDAIKVGEGKTFIDYILKAGFDVKKCRINGKTLLSFAAEYGNLEIIEYLVQKGFDCNATNRDGKKPLHIAAKHSHQDVVKFFINLGVGVNSCDNFNCTPLHYAAETFHRNVIRPNVWNSAFYNIFNNTMFSVTCSASVKHRELVYFLLVSGADFDASDSKGNVPLLLAAKNSCVDVVRMLIMWGANVQCCDDKKWTVLHYASFAGWLDVVQSIVEKDIDVNVETLSGDTPMAFAVNNSHKQVVELLIESGANIGSCNIFKMTVLHHASEKGWLNAVQSLVDRGSDVNTENCSGDTPLILAIKYSHRAIFDLLVKSGASLDCCDNSKKTVLHRACQTGWLDVAQSLVEGGSDIYAETTNGDTPLLLAVKYSHKEIVNMLFESGAHFHSSKLKMKKQMRLLHYACREGRLDVVQSLLKEGCDINVKTRDFETPLFTAAKFSHIDIFDCLIEAGADADATIPPNSYYNRVCEGSGSDLDSDDEQEWTLLHHACHKGWLEAVKSLTKKGIDINVKTFENETPLHLAIKYYYLEIAKHLLKAGADSNIRNENNETALDYHIRYCKLSAETIRLFFENGSYIQQYEYEILSKHAFFKEGILQDAELCTQAFINEFNNLDLEEVYEVPLAVEYLPDIERMKIKRNGNMAHSIEQTVRHEIETNGYCNIVEVRPIVLSLLSVRSFIQHYI